MHLHSSLGDVEKLLPLASVASARARARRRVPVRPRPKGSPTTPDSRSRSRRVPHSPMAWRAVPQTSRAHFARGDFDRSDAGRRYEDGDAGDAGDAAFGDGDGFPPGDAESSRGVGFDPEPETETSPVASGNLASADAGARLRVLRVLRFDRSFGGFDGERAQRSREEPRDGDAERSSSHADECVYGGQSRVARARGGNPPGRSSPPTRRRLSRRAARDTHATRATRRRSRQPRLPGVGVARSRFPPRRVGPPFVLAAGPLPLRPRARASRRHPACAASRAAISAALPAAIPGSNRPAARRLVEFALERLQKEFPRGDLHAYVTIRVQTERPNRAPERRREPARPMAYASFQDVEESDARAPRRRARRRVAKNLSRRATREERRHRARRVPVRPDETRSRPARPVVPDVADADVANVSDSADATAAESATTTPSHAASRSASASASESAPPRISPRVRRERRGDVRDGGDRVRGEILVPGRRRRRKPPQRRRQQRAARRSRRLQQTTQRNERSFRANRRPLRRRRRGGLPSCASPRPSFLGARRGR